MNTSQDETSTGLSPMMIGGLVLGGILLLLLIPTLRSTSTPQIPETEVVKAGDVSRSQCERTLDSAVDGLQPVRLGISSERRVMVDTLNNWLEQCADPAPADGDEQDEQLRRALLTPAGFEQSENGRFQLRDAEHIRNSLLAVAIVDRVVTGLRSDHQRALALFYYVVRTIDLVPDDASEVVLTPYDSLMLGMGTVADRAWTYALLMRQLRLDVVVVQPQTEGDDPYWLLGAVIPGEGVLLLDPRLGLPIATESDVQNPETALPAQAATLTQVRETDDLLRHFDQEDKPYPLSAEDLASVDVLAIGTSSLFAPRMARLQAQLNQPVELYDGLATNEQRQSGLLERLTEAGSNGLWTAEQIGAWPYPEDHWSSGEPSDAQLKWIADRDAVLSGPYSVAITVNSDDEGNLIVGSEVNKPQNTLRQTRIAQLLGNVAAAQQGYLQVRVNHVNMRPVQQYFKLAQETLTEQGATPEQMQQTFASLQQHVGQEVNRIMQTLPELQYNVAAADMATYWAAQLQYDQQDYRLAAESALAYVERIGGRFVMPAIYLANLSLAQDDRPEEAIALTDQRPPEAKLSPGYQALVSRWKKLSGASVTEAPDDADPPAAESKSTGTKSSAEDKKDAAPSGKPDEEPAAENVPAEKPTDNTASDGESPATEPESAPDAGDGQPADS